MMNAIRGFLTLALVLVAVGCAKAKLADENGFCTEGAQNEIDNLSTRQANAYRSGSQDMQSVGKELLSIADDCDALVKHWGAENSCKKADRRGETTAALGGTFYVSELQSKCAQIRSTGEMYSNQTGSTGSGSQFPGVTGGQPSGYPYYPTNPYND